MSFKVIQIGQWCSPNWRADIECNTVEEFKKLPIKLKIDGRIFTKKSYGISGKRAFYHNEVEIAIDDPSINGTFEISEHLGDGKYDTYSLVVDDVVI